MSPSAQSYYAIDEHARRIRTLETLGTDILTPALSPLALPMLRAFWPFTSVNESENVLDLSGQARTLSDNGSVGYGFDLLAAYSDLNGVTAYFSRADEAGLSFSKNFTLFGWFRHDTLGALTGYASKWTAAGDQREYRLYKDANDNPVFEVSGDGTAGAVDTVTSSETLAADTWYFIAGLFDNDNAEITIVVNDVETVGATVAAMAFDSTSAFEIGRTDGAGYLDGRVSMCGMCAAVLNASALAALFRNQRSIFGV